MAEMKMHLIKEISEIGIATINNGHRYLEVARKLADINDDMKICKAYNLLAWTNKTAGKILEEITKGE